MASKAVNVVSKTFVVNKSKVAKTGTNYFGSTSRTNLTENACGVCSVGKFNNFFPSPTNDIFVLKVQCSLQCVSMHISSNYVLLIRKPLLAEPK